MKQRIWTSLSKTIGDRLIIATILFSMWAIAFSPASQSQVVNSTQNTRQIALLHWYQANQTANFGVGTRVAQTDPLVWGVAVDGANIWVSWNSCNYGDFCGVDGGGVDQFFVSKLRASDGATLGTFAVGWAGPLAFDGANIWVGGDALRKLRASDGATLGIFSTGWKRAETLAFDGTNIWWAYSGSSGTPGSVTKVRASDGTVLSTFTAGVDPYALAFDGANIWVANKSSDTVTKLRASDGIVLGTFTVGVDPYALAFDGANIWVANSSGTVTKLRASDGSVLGTFTVGVDPYALAFDGANIWVADGISNTVTELQARDGATLGTFTVTVGGGSPAALAFDGANVWVAIEDGSIISVSKL